MAHRTWRAVMWAACGWAGGAAAQMGPVQQSLDLGTSLFTPGAEDSRQSRAVLGVRSALLYSDNLRLAPSGQQERGTIAELSPYVIATVNRPQQQGSLFYTLRNFYSFRDSESDAGRHDLRANGRMAVAGDTLWLAGRAYVYDVNASPFTTTSFDPSLSATNRSRYQLYEASPFVTGRLNQRNDYFGQYIASYTNLGSTDQHITAQQLNGRLRGDFQDSTLGWQGQASTQHYNYSSGFNYDRSEAEMGVNNRFTSTLRAGVSATYASSQQLVSQSGKTHGWGPGAFVDWRPEETTQLFAKTVQQYYGNVSNIRLTQRASAWVFGLDYRRSVVDASQAAVLAYDPSLLTGASTDPSQPGGSSGSSNSSTQAGGLAQQGTVLDNGAPLAAGFLAAPLIWQRNLTATALLAGPRDSISVVAFRGDRRAIATDATFPAVAGALANLDQYGATARYMHRLTPVSAAVLSSQLTRSVADSSIGSSTLVRHQVAYIQRFSPQWTGSLGYRHSKQTGDGAAIAQYTENALIVGIDLRF